MGIHSVTPKKIHVVYLNEEMAKLDKWIKLFNKKIKFYLGYLFSNQMVATI